MKRILVIDDKDDIRSVIVSTLSNARFATEEAVDAEQGLRSAKLRKPDLILCDINMPGMDGCKTLPPSAKSPNFRHRSLHPDDRLR